ncbi:hypothetical protein PIB30_028066 [Stylosanthes scabra]|uniref:Uncharacterized protein n=1 Tax=Stylosanthes scabra TaxID=79078 RepID=A0ABU6RB67_9FABA|nr:hypothetical protein [Stylosanthes scabra]
MKGEVTAPTWSLQPSGKKESDRGMEYRKRKRERDGLKRSRAATTFNVSLSRYRWLLPSPSLVPLPPSSKLVEEARRFVAMVNRGGDAIVVGARRRHLKLLPVTPSWLRSIVVKTMDKFLRKCSG